MIPQYNNRSMMTGGVFTSLMNTLLQTVEVKVNVSFIKIKYIFIKIQPLSDLLPKTSS